MSNTKHTRGPWERPVTTQRNSLGRPQATVRRENAIGQRNVVATVFGNSLEEAEANAKLIAAAPEMYAMLVEFANQTRPDVKKFQQHCLDLLTRIS